MRKVSRERIHVLEDGSYVEFDAIVIEKDDGTFHLLNRSEKAPCDCQGLITVFVRKALAGT